MYIYSSVKNGRLYVESAAPIDTYRIYDKGGIESVCPVLSCEKKGDVYVTELDASTLEEYSVHARIYRLEAAGEVVLFCYTDNQSMNDEVQGRKVQRKKDATPYIYSNVSAGLLYAQTAAPISSYTICDGEGNQVDCPKMLCKQTGDVYVTTFDASNLKCWSVNDPVLYTMEVDGYTIRFGHTTIRTHQNKEILLNEKPFYVRGYIRGIVAHDHPNMTGLSDYEAAVKNIKQAKKYGFNLVRFHTTIPSDDFVRAADELGMLIQVETGYVYERILDPETGKNKKIIRSFGETLWEDTVCRFRNHPSIAIFCIGNEMRRSAQYPEVHTMIDQGREMAPTKLFMDNCGWGEFDRSSADIYVQHMGYFLPYAAHDDMFESDRLFRDDGSAYQVPLNIAPKEGVKGNAIKRNCATLKPVLAHEAMHYVDIPDYAALEKKFDDFCEKVGPAYLEKHGIKKPKYFAGLRKLIAERGIEDIMPEYTVATQKMRLLCTKLYLEKLRLSQKLCGYEMLQLSDCLKYENKNGILDFFDDDKYFDPKWMLQINDDLVLLADFHKERMYEDESFRVDLYASDYMEQFQMIGDLEVTLDGESVYVGEKFTLAGGLQKLAELTLYVQPSGKPQAHTLAARFASGEIVVTNSWKLWTYPRVRPAGVPEMALTNQALAQYLGEGSKKSDLFVTDALNQQVFDKLDEGKTVVLFYAYKAQQNTWDVQGAIERFKPCIWDRGSNLGGIIVNKAVEEALGDDRYFDRNVQPLLDVSSKVNLDTWNWKVTQHVRGIDKPIRDRYQAVQGGTKDFIPEATLRQFSHLFSVKMGKGTLVVCTFNVKVPETPVVSNLLEKLIDHPELFGSDCQIDAGEFKAWLEQVNAAGFREEDKMNQTWQNDQLSVEKVLFWEDLNMNLADIK